MLLDTIIRVIFYVIVTMFILSFWIQVWKVLDCIAVMRDLLMNGRRYFKVICDGKKIIH
jgi:hypothetical protein